MASAPPPLPASRPPPVPISAPPPTPASGPPSVPIMPPQNKGIPLPVPSTSQNDPKSTLPVHMPMPPTHIKPPHPVHEDAAAISHDVDSSSPVHAVMTSDDTTTEDIIQHNEEVPSSVPAAQHEQKREKWLPAGAVPTALNFSVESLKPNKIRYRYNEDSYDSHFGKQAEQAGHVRTPSDIEEEEGSIVKARYPFNGNPEMLQMSFNIGDEILILQRDDRWSWGKVVKTGEEGFFPHSYIKGAYQPLLGLHNPQLSAKLFMRRKKIEEDERRHSIAEGNNISSNSLEGEMDTSLQTQQQHNDEGMECPPTVPTFDASVLLAKAPVSLSNLKDELETSVSSDVKQKSVRVSEHFKDKLDVILLGDQREEKRSSSRSVMSDGEEIKQAPPLPHQTDAYNSTENSKATGGDLKEEGDVNHYIQKASVSDNSSVKNALPPPVNKAPPPIPRQHVADPEHITNENPLKTERVTGTDPDGNGGFETEKLPTNLVEEAKPANSGCKCTVS